MPVEDHEVHEKVRISADDPYGCHSKSTGPLRANGYYAPDRRYKPDGTFYIVQEFIRHVTSTSCRNFYIWDTDPRCFGCTQPKDIEYALRMKGLE